MTSESRRLVVLCTCVFLAAVVQCAWADALPWRAAHPDLLTATTVVCALFCSANEGAGIGLLAGWLLASVCAPPHSGYGSLIVSRTLVGFLVGWLEERTERDNPLLAVVLALAGTAVACGLCFLFAPPSQHFIAHSLRGMLLTTITNTAFAYPLWALVRRALGRTERSR